MSKCCEANVVWHKGEYVCSCCGMTVAATTANSKN